MIWLWIAVAVFITLFLLRKENIEFNHLIWILLPVDFYGVEFSGVVIKPYMLFALLILVHSLFRNKAVGLRLNLILISGLLFLFCMLLFADFMNGSTMSSLLQQLMFVTVVLCAIIYLGSIDASSDITQIGNVIVASAVGYGLVYIFAVLLNSWGYSFEGLSTMVRGEPGILLKFTDIPDGRLRGFNIDPNAAAISFIPPIAFSIYQMHEKNHEKKFLYFMQIIISLFCCFFTKSRMAILVFLALVAITTVGVRKRNRKINVKVVCILLILVIAVAALFLLHSHVLNNSLNGLLEQYQGRSDFNDPYGRGSLWKSAWNILYEKNFLFGLGQGQVSGFSALSRDCHNTWLEWIVGNGILAGSVVDLCFLLVFALFSGHCRRNRSIDGYSGLIHSLKWSYAGILVILLSVSNITNSYLIFTASLAVSLMLGKPKHEDQSWLKTAGYESQQMES